MRLRSHTHTAPLSCLAIPYTTPQYTRQHSAKLHFVTLLYYKHSTHYTHYTHTHYTHYTHYATHSTHTSLHKPNATRHCTTPLTALRYTALHCTKLHLHHCTTIYTARLELLASAHAFSLSLSLPSLCLRCSFTQWWPAGNAQTPASLSLAEATAVCTWCGKVTFMVRQCVRWRLSFSRRVLSRSIEMFQRCACVQQEMEFGKLALVCPRTDEGS